MPFRLESPWGVTLMFRVCDCDGLGQNKIVRVGKISGPVLSRLLTKVHETLWHRRRPFVLSNVIGWLFMSRFIQQIFAIKSRSRRKTEQVFWPPFSSRGTTPTFLQHILARSTYRPCKVWLSSVCWSPSAKPGNEVECGIYGGFVETTVHIEAVCRPKFMSFWDDVVDP